MMDKKKYLVTLMVVVLLFGAALTGCVDDDEENDVDNGEDNGVDNGLTGTETYSGEWSGSIYIEDYSGTWEFEVDFDEGTVTGWFSGDGSGDITGSVSDGVIQASGGAAFGTIEWSGDFSADGEEISGTWEVADDHVDGSGTWSGEIGEADENGDVGNGEEDQELLWNAFEFEEKVEEDGDEIGTLTEFTYVQTYSEEGSVKEFEVHTTYKGITETEITVVKYDLTDYSEEEVSFTIDAYELEHRVEVLRDDEDEGLPEWSELTVYLPSEEFDTGGEYFWIFAKAEYVDSDGRDGLWSYYLTEDMQDEQAGGDTMYAPYVENDLYNYDSWVLFGLYGFGWMWFEPLAESYFEEGSVDVTTPGGSFSYQVEETTVSLSGYTFTGYEVTCSAVTFEDSVELKGTFVPSLSVPVYLRVGDDSTSYEIELTHVAFE